jgi:undecaprenyl-diphosphatase
LAFAETLKSLDRKLFLLLNQHHNPQMDNVMYWMSNEYIWIPFYAVILGLMIYYFRKQSWLLILLISLLITSSDQLSGFLKNTVKRLRPCHNPEISNLVHTLNHCGGNFGFVSSHAANSFALATFITLLLSVKYEYLAWLMFSWAVVVSYSRIYLGVHYPADVGGGALLGILLGWLFFKVYSMIVNKKSIALQA